MQDTKLLSSKQINLINTAKEHINTCYRKRWTSMAAVLETTSDKFYTGINVKYHKVWKCICAERVAIAKALEAGETKFCTIVTVKYFPEKDEYEVVNMCGERRQLTQFHEGLKVIADDNGKLKAISVIELLPFSYK